MIERYTRPEMGRIWSEQNKFQKWLDVELAVCEVFSEVGKIPPHSFRVIKERAGFDIKRILEIEQETNHDVIAFLTNVAENVGPDSRFIHYGMTSSDVLDTALALQILEAGALLKKDLLDLKDILGQRALEFKDTVCIGRSHGIHAEPITFGLKLALWYEEINRQIERLDHANEMMRVGNESRVFPILDLDAKKSTYIEPIIEKLSDLSFNCYIEKVPYEFQKGGNEMLKITRNEN